MAQKRFLIPLVLLAAVCLPFKVWAEATCYHADADSGELTFHGAVEGTSFRGSFREFDVRLCLGDGGPESAGVEEIEVRLQMASATVGNRQGDEALRGRDMFGVAEYPEAVWRSRTIESSDNGYLAHGELSLRDVSADQTVELQLEREGDGYRLGGSAQILRLDFNVGQGEFADPEFIRNEIDLRFELQLEPIG